MPEVMGEIPELRGVRRGGLQQTLKRLIDDARLRAVKRLGTEKEQAAMASGLGGSGRPSSQRTRSVG
jgi:hypothetical protein